MIKGLFVIAFLTMTAVGQSDQTPSEAARTFLQRVGNGEFELAGGQVFDLLIADGKVVGTTEQPPVSTALAILHDSGFKYHKELSVETSKDTSRVYVEMLRLPDVEVFVIHLVRIGREWKISGWRRLSPPVKIRPPGHPNLPIGIPYQKPCPGCT